MRKWLSSAVPILALLAPFAGEARAEPLPLETRVRVGRPAHPVTLRVEEGELILRGRRGEAVRAELPIGSPEAAQVREVRLAGGAGVAVVELSGGDRRGAAVVVARRGKPRVLWSARLDPHGDPGERRGAAVLVEDRTGDGRPDVVVARTRESTAICGQERTLLFPHAVHPRTLELTPVVLRRLPESPPAGERRIEATPDSPGPEGAPVLRRLHVRSASSMSGAGDDPAHVPPPTALRDGDPNTVWLEGHGSEGRWEFATLRFDGGRFPIRALAITPSPADAARAKELGRPRSLWLVGDRGPRIHVTLPDDPADRPGEPYWVVPERPLHWRCLSIVIDDVIPPEGAREGTVRTGLAEVDVFTDLDFGEGLGTLVADLDRPGREGAAAASLLASVGPRVVPLLRQRWSALSPRARTRAARALGPHVEGSAEARALLLEAARTGAPAVRRAALDALQRGGPPATGELASLAAEHDGIGDRAAMALALVAPGEAIEPLLGLLARPEGASRPALRRALARAVSASGEPATQAVRAWAQADPDPSAGAAAALALSRAGGHPDLVHRLIAAVAPRATRFEDRWRLVRATRGTPADPAVDRWLATVVREAQEWMLRAAALTSLAHRDPEAALDLAGTALADPYPRVRAAGAEELGRARSLIIPVAKLARRDEWPLVRERAVRALAPHAEALPVIRAAILDPAAAVRGAAIETVTGLGDRQAWPKVRDRLTSDREDATVRSAAIAYAHRLCIRSAAPDLADIVEAGMAPDASVRDRDLAAEAIRALVALGGPEAKAVLGRAAGERAPALLRATVARARRHEQQCGGGDAPNP